MVFHHFPLKINIKTPQNEPLILKIFFGRGTVAAKNHTPSHPGAFAAISRFVHFGHRKNTFWSLY